MKAIPLYFQAIFNRQYTQYSAEVVFRYAGLRNGAPYYSLTTFLDVLGGEMWKNADNYWVMTINTAGVASSGYTSHELTGNQILTFYQRVTPETTMFPRVKHCDWIIPDTSWTLINDFELNLLLFKDATAIQHPITVIPLPVEVPGGFDDAANTPLPQTIVPVEREFGDFVYSNTVRGWVSSISPYIAILHPTSKFNSTTDWLFINGGVVLAKGVVIPPADTNTDKHGHAMVYAIPVTFESVHTGEVVLTTGVTPQAVVVSNITLPPATTCVEVSVPGVTDVPLPPLGNGVKDSSESYFAYVDVASGKRTLSIYLGQEPKLYQFDEIFNPDLDYNRTDLELSKLIVPCVGSMIVDRDLVSGAADVRVVSEIVDTATGPKTITVPMTNVIGVDRADTGILNLSSDPAYLFYIEEDGTPSKSLTVDHKLVGLTANAGSYRLKNSGGFDIAGIGTGTEVTYGPVDIINEQGINKFNNCVSTYPINDGDVITLEVFTTGGSLISMVSLIAKSALAITNQQANSAMITGFDVISNQTDGDGLFWLTVDGDRSDLSMTPKLTYSDGTEELLYLDRTGVEIIDSDNAVQVYGIDNIDTSTVGDVSQSLVFKYYIPQYLNTALGVDNDGEGNFLSIIKQVKIVAVT